MGCKQLMYMYFMCTAVYRDLRSWCKATFYSNFAFYPSSSKCPLTVGILEGSEDSVRAADGDLRGVGLDLQSNIMSVDSVK